MKKNNRGITLLEMLLVLAIAGSVFAMMVSYVNQRSEEMRIDRAAQQFQGIMNAALAYYVNNSQWPLTCDGGSADLTTLQYAGYLPIAQLTNPWGNAYSLSCTGTTQVLTVSTVIPVGTAITTTPSILAGRIPMGWVTGNIVSGRANIPSQSLNNARSVNFASVYHSGACVPVPTCPVPSMTATIMVVPVSISGVNDDPVAAGKCTAGSDYTTCSNISVFPISSYTAVAYPQTAAQAGTNTAPTCGNPAVGGACLATSSGGQLGAGNYWRVCLSVATEKGTITPTNRTWGGAVGSILAITRCNSSENQGSNFQVWQN